MDNSHSVEMLPTDVILAILTGRRWPTFLEHIRQDWAWKYVTNPNPAVYDYRDGAPSDVTMQHCLAGLIAAGLIRRAAGLPVAFEATERGHESGRVPQDEIRAAMARS